MDNLPGQLSLFPEEPAAEPLMTIEEMKEHKWHISWSGGKDSTATIILCHELGVPVENITYIRMMYDETTPATLPIMTDFVDHAAETFRAWGYNVRMVKSLQTAKEVAEHPIKRAKDPERIGKPNGAINFLRGGCGFTRVKINTIKKLLPHDDVYEMVGYAADETARLHRLGGKYQSVLVATQVNEADTFAICNKYGLLSPLYGRGIGRDGCWFCPNCNKRERENLKREHPELHKEIIKMIEMVDIPLDRWAYMNNWAKDYDDYLKEKDQTTLF